MKYRKKLDKFSLWYDKFSTIAMSRALTTFLPVALMMEGFNSPEWIWYYSVAIILFTIGDYFR